MLMIGNSTISLGDRSACLSAPVSVSSHETRLWFSVDRNQETFLAAGRADPFVMALLPLAMRGGHDIECLDPMSARLHFQLTTSLIPSLASMGTLYHEIRIKAPLTDEPVRNGGAVGTGFSGGVDSLYTVFTHGPDCEYPLTHLAVFNAGVFEGKSFRDAFAAACSKAAQFAGILGLDTVFVDTNLQEALPERFLDVYSFRNIACALALQGLFSRYLLSSGHDAGHMSFDLHNTATFDVLTVSCSKTENLVFYNSGSEIKRNGKLAALTLWPVSYNWLHPCIFGRAGDKNCGRCKKCVRDLTSLYALNALELYGEVFDTEDFRLHLAARIGFVLANRGNHLYDDTIRLLEERHAYIPAAAFIYGKQFYRLLHPQADSEDRQV